MHIYLAQINPTIGDLKGNFFLIAEEIEKAKEQKASLILFPEMSLTGYPPEDLLLLPHFIEEVQKYCEKVQKLSSGIVVVLGAVRKNMGAGKPLFNSAFVFSEQKLLGVQDKTLLPTYDVFDELRYFEPAREQKVFVIGENRVAVTICEDIWVAEPESLLRLYEENPLEKLLEKKVDLLLNISASPFSIGKREQRFLVAHAAAKLLRCPVVFCNQIGGNDSLIFDGASFCVSQEGKVTSLFPSFISYGACLDLKRQEPFAYTPALDEEDLFQALTLGVRDYFQKLRMKKALVGVSGGVDSALVLAVAVQALGSENVTAIAMPSRFSSSKSFTDAKALCKNLSVHLEVVEIETVYKEYLELLHPLFPDNEFGVTEENLQARIRGMILMAFSNKLGSIVLSTGNKSEMAMGYSTLYGDLCGGLGVISDVTKGQVYAVCRWLNKPFEVIPESIITKEPSAELRPDQKDSDSLPDYAIIDHVLEEYVVKHNSLETIVNKYGYAEELVRDLIKRIHYNEYKRRQAPPGLRVSAKAFSYGRRFPIVQGWV